MNKEEKERLIKENEKLIRDLEFFKNFEKEICEKYNISIFKFYYCDNNTISIETKSEYSTYRIESIITEALPIIENNTGIKYRKSNVSPVCVGDYPRNLETEKAYYTLYKNNT